MGRSDDDAPHNTPNGALRNSPATTGVVDTGSGGAAYRGLGETVGSQMTTERPLSRRSRARARIRRSTTLNTGYRIAVAVVGAAVIVAGLAMLVLPGPGWAAIFIGLAILATEFIWARRLKNWAHGVYERTKNRALERRARRKARRAAKAANSTPSTPGGAAGGLR